jgi:hypothetical protein
MNMFSIFVTHLKEKFEFKVHLLKTLCDHYLSNGGLKDNARCKMALRMFIIFRSFVAHSKSVVIGFFYVPCIGMAELYDLGGRIRCFTKYKLFALSRFT